MGNPPGIDRDSEFLIGIPELGANFGISIHLWLAFQIGQSGMGRGQGARERQGLLLVL